MSEYTLDDYRNAPSGVGPLAAQWADKPHRLVYDLASKLTQAEARVAALEKAGRRRFIG